MNCHDTHIIKDYRPFSLHVLNLLPCVDMVHFKNEKGKHYLILYDSLDENQESPEDHGTI